MKAADIKAGDKVNYMGVVADVIEVCKNGVRISYWWKTPAMLEPENRKERVSARYLTPAA